MSATYSPNSAFSNVAGKKIGILALQGDVAMHAQALGSLGVETHLVKMPSQLEDIDALVIPGGESTTLLKLAGPIGMLPAIAKFAQNGGSIFGTCAGAIVLARTVANPAQTSLGLIDITIQRNGYGRQIDSRAVTGQGHAPFATGKLPMTFIRAPRITVVGESVKILATYHDEPVLVQQNGILAATFHPEIQGDTSVYKYWLAVI